MIAAARREVTITDVHTPPSSLALVTVLALAAPTLGSCTSDPTLDSQAPEVRNGTNAPGEINKVFLLISPFGEAHVGSASNVKYKRCLLTAAHVVGEPIQGMQVYRGQDLRNLDDKEFQNIAAGEIVPDAARVSRDLAVLWATNQLTRPPTPPPPGGGADAGNDAGTGGGGTGGDPGEKRIPLGGWSPQTMIDTIGLGNAQVGQPFPGPPSTGAPKAITIVGYGNNTTNAAGDDVGDSVLRSGAMDATHYFDTTQQNNVADTTGGFYYLAPKAGAQSVCQGDSGGPARTAAGIFAVISDQVGATCATSTAGFATALNRAKLGTDISNWDWVQQAVARVCKKDLSTGVMGQGKVTGTIAPAQEHTEETWLNNQLRCGNSAPNLTDCGEFVHENQSITLTATPASGWRFVRWFAMGGHCQCNNSTATTCAIGYDAMGEYTQTSSSDSEGCHALFEPIPVSDAGADG